jgi:hypothetical protein
MPWMRRTFQARGQCFMVVSRWIARRDVVVPFVPDEAREAVLPGEAVDQALAVLPGATGEVARHAEGERAVAPVRHEVDPTALVHGTMILSCFSSSIVMPALVAGIHAFFCAASSRHGWPDQVRP